MVFGSVVEKRLRRLDLLSARTGLGLGTGAGILLGAGLLWQGSMAAAVAGALLASAGAAALAWSGEPVAVLDTPPLAPQTPQIDDTPLRMVLLPGGTFQMGSPDDEVGRYDDEGPRHQVAVSRFWIAQTQVTRGQYREVMGGDPEQPDGDDLPVTDVSWFDAVRFCNRLSKLRGLRPCYVIGDDEQVTWDRAADGYRLPTEAEWEYAARAGSDGRFCFGDDEAMLGEYAWYGANAGGRVHPVGQKKANGFGLHDMHGNVYEWCWDWLGAEVKDRHSPPSPLPWERQPAKRAVREDAAGEAARAVPPHPTPAASASPEGEATAAERLSFITLGAYGPAEQTDPMGPLSGSARVLRGGSFVDGPGNLRSASRLRGGPQLRVVYFGFRCVRGGAPSMP